MAEANFTFTGRIRSVKCALRGIRLVLRTQHNAWVHAAATFAACAAGLILQIDRYEWCWIILAIVAVWTAEALNTALELLCDVSSPAFHPLIEKAKDVAAGSVLISAIGSVVIGFLIFGPHLFALLNQSAGSS